MLNKKYSNTKKIKYYLNKALIVYYRYNYISLTSIFLKK